MSTKSSLTVSTEIGSSVAVTINDPLDLLLKSPLVTQLFARAVAGVILKTVTGVILEVVVEIGATQNAIEYHHHTQKVQLQIEKLTVTSDAYAKALKKAEDSSQYPKEISDEFRRRLLESFYDDMEKLTIGRMP